MNTTTTRFKKHQARFRFADGLYTPDTFLAKHRSAKFVFVHGHHNEKVGGQTHVSWKGEAFGEIAEALATEHSPAQDKANTHWRVVELATGNIVIEG